MRIDLMASLLCCALGCSHDTSAPAPVAPRPIDAAPVTPAPPGDPAVALLARDLDPAGPWVYLSMGSAPRWGLGGKGLSVLEIARHEPGPMTILRESGDDLLLREQGPSVRFLVRARKAELLPVIVRDTVAVPDGVLVNRGHLRLREGTPVEIVEQRRDRVRVKLSDGWHELTAEVDAARVGDRVDGEPPPFRPFEGTLRLTHGTVLRAAPRGDAPAVLRVSSAYATPAGRSAHGWQEVDVETYRVRARGFVPTAAITAVAAPPASPPRRAPSPRALQPYESLIPYGACVRDRPGGEIIGIVTADLPAVAAPLDGGWREVNLGSAGLLVQPAVLLDGPDGPELCLSTQGTPLR